MIAQAERRSARHASDDRRDCKTRNAAGADGAAERGDGIKDIAGPDRIQRYDLYTSAEINGTTAPGYSSGQAIAVMEELARSKVCRRQFSL